MKIITSADGTKKHLYLKIHNEKTEKPQLLINEIRSVSAFLSLRYFKDKIEPDNFKFGYVDDDFLNNQITLRLTFNLLS